MHVCQQLSCRYLCGTYAEIFSGFAEIVADFSDSDRHALFVERRARVRHLTVFSLCRVKPLNYKRLNQSNAAAHVAEAR